MVIMGRMVPFRCLGMILTFYDEGGRVSPIIVRYHDKEELKQT